MAVQIWRRDSVLQGRLASAQSGQTTIGLSTGGSFEISAPYAAWQGLMQVEPDFQLVEISGPGGEEIMRGVWLTRDDDPLPPGLMTIGGSDLLDELRIVTLPPQYYLNNHPALSALAAVLEYQTDWSLGDTSLASDVPVTTDLGGLSVLQAIMDICELSGNFFRHDGWNRRLDVFSEPPPGVKAHLVVCSDDSKLPSDAARVEMAPVTVDCGEVLRGIVPVGGTYRDGNDRERTLVLDGSESLPPGFSFQLLSGQLAIINERVDYGLVRTVYFDSVQPLSNMTVSASGIIARSGSGWLESEAVRRPSDGFWSGGVLEVGGAEFGVKGHSGDRIYGSFGTLPQGASFTLRKELVWDEAAVRTARQSLAQAAWKRLQRFASPSVSVVATVDDLDVRLAPGDRVWLSVVGEIELEEPFKSLKERYLWSGTHGELVVTQVTALLGEERLRYQLDLADRLRPSTTVEGLAETRQLVPRAPVTGMGRGRGVAYTVLVRDSDPACGTNSRQATLNFPTPYPVAPILLEAVPLREGYSVVSTVLTTDSVTVCVQAEGAFDEVNVLIRVREP